MAILIDGCGSTTATAPPIIAANQLTAPLNEVHQRRTLRERNSTANCFVRSVLPCGSRDAKRGRKVLTRYGFDSTAIGVHTERCIFKITTHTSPPRFHRMIFRDGVDKAHQWSRSFSFAGHPAISGICLKLQLLDAEAAQPQTPPS